MLLKCFVFVLLVTSTIAVDPSSEPVQGHRRVDCFPEPGASQSACQSRGCEWDYQAGNTYNEPACYFPAGSGGYTITGSSTANPVTLSKTRGVNCPFGTDAPSLSVQHTTTNNALRVRITSPTQVKNTLKPCQVLGMPAFEEDVERYETKGDAVTQLTYNGVTDPNGVYSFQITRASTGRVLFDTSIGPIMLTEQYIQIASQLPSNYVYGIGEHNHAHFLRDTSHYKKWPMWARDEPPYPGDPQKNLYGVHAVYMVMEGDGNAHGVFILNTHAQEVEFGPAPHFVYRALGGDFDMYFLPGPTPQDVIQQYHMTINAPPTLPAYWSLGFQICRYGYANLDAVKAVVNKMKALGIPQDVQYIDIDYMDARKDFTYDKVKFAGLPEFIEDIHSDDYSMRFILILDPAIQVEYASFTRGLTANAYINWPNASMVPATNAKYPSSTGSTAMLGRVWPDLNTAFPDFYQASARTWWTNELKMLHDTLNYDGLWVDMNEPSCFSTNDPDQSSTPNLQCSSNSLENPPYKTKGIYQFGNNLQMSTKTLCMVGKQIDGTHYRYHNLYGLQESIATNLGIQSALNKRPVVISRSTFPTSGKYAGHWLGDNTANWESMKSSIVGILDMNMFGITYTGADICGFIGDSTEELCLRWMQLGSFYSFSRNHNTIGAAPQDPTQWPTVAAASKQALTFRYHYLPYLYTLMAFSSRQGGAVLRPLLLNFPSDVQTYTVDEQFMWGDGLLISPVLAQGAKSVTAYIPDGKWYDATVDGRVISPGYKSFSAEWTEMIPVQIRGGSILPRQLPARTTKLARLNTMELAIAVDQVGKATGELIWDAGDDVITSWSTHDYWHILFQYQQTGTSGTLTVSALKTSATVALPKFNLFDIFGANHDIDRTQVTVNGSPVAVSPTTTYNSATGRLELYLATPVELSSVKTTITFMFK